MNDMEKATLLILITWSGTIFLLSSTYLFFLIKEKLQKKKMIFNKSKAKSKTCSIKSFIFPKRLKHNQQNSKEVQK